MMGVKTGKLPLLKDAKAWLLCPRCHTGSVIYLSKTNKFRCKRCGGLFRADFAKHTTKLMLEIKQY